MRTLKKTLCMVLCLAMMAGYCCIAASADYTDSAEIKYEEAVAVLTGIGVINGMGDGTFAPNRTLTRAQACKIIVYLIKEEKAAAVCNFEDCKNHWAADYIAVCAEKGIVVGYGDGKFGPEDPLTGVAFAKMLLCALGYDAEAEGMIGEKWAAGVTDLVIENQLANGVDKFAGTAVISRQEACQLAFNALFAAKVSYDAGTEKAKPNGKSLKDLFALKDTTSTAEPDAYFHKAVKQWSAGKAETPVYTAYQKADWTYSNASGIYKAPADVAATYAKETGMKATEIKVLYADGPAYDMDSFPGTVCEFAVSADKKTLTFICACEYYYYQVVDVSDTADKNVSYKKNIELSDGTVLHEDELKIACKKGDWIAAMDIWNIAGDSNDLFGEATMMNGISGQLTAYYAASNTVTVNGAELIVDDDIIDDGGILTGSEYPVSIVYYLSPNGMLAGIEAAE